MNTMHEFLSKIPYERISHSMVKAKEHFDVCKLGKFNNEIVELVRLQAKSNYTPHYHKNSCAVIYMILGEGICILGNKEVSYQPGVRFNIPKKLAHGFLTATETVFLSIQTPPISNRQSGEVDLFYV